MANESESLESKLIRLRSKRFPTRARRLNKGKATKERGTNGKRRKSKRSSDILEA